jgi:hypothetical protein
MRSIRGLALVCVCAALLTPACSRSNNLLLGRVEADVAGHTVAVTDCYRTKVPAPEIVTTSSGSPTYRFAPCRDAVVTIKDDELRVNGKGYGKLGPGDAVLVDHGVVSTTKATARR